MRQTPLFSGIIYILLGCLFTYFAIHNVREDGWGLFPYILVMLATFDIGTGIRAILFSFHLKNKGKKKK